MTNEKKLRLGKFTLCLTVKNLQASKDFYEKLGFEVTGGKLEENWLLMTNGDANIAIMHGMFDKNMLTFIPNQDRDGEALKNFTDVRDIQKHLKENGIEFKEEAEAGTGPAYFTIVDPDGNPIMVDQH